MSSTADTSHSAFLRRRKGLTIATNIENNPSRPLVGLGAMDQTTLNAARIGEITYTVRPELGPAIVQPPCCPAPSCGNTLNVNVVLESLGPFAPPYNTWASQYLITWNLVSGATSYTVTCTNDYTSHAIQPISNTSAYIYFNYDYIYIETISVTAATSCGTTVRGTYTFPPCFLAGSPVTMADGSTKVIENVAIGEKVLGAFGEHNTVLALHRPLLGPAAMLKINGVHSTSAHHPHIGANKQIYSYNPAIVEKALNNRSYPVINETGATVMRQFTGLKPGRLQKLVRGVELKTVDGSSVVTSLEEYRLPADTQLYNLVLDGSHTYYVDGYAVTGWPREDDFDYDTWTPK